MVMRVFPTARFDVAHPVFDGKCNSARPTGLSLARRTTKVSKAMTRAATDTDQLSIDTIRLLAADAVQKAKSGHPGTPMGAAPTAYALWQRYLRYDLAAPGWMDRDNFVLSEGHASMLLYALIHLAGVKDGDQVILNPPVDLTDGSAVKARPGLPAQIS